MSPVPRLGEPDNNSWAVGLCGFALDETSPVCMADATWHGVIDDGTDEWPSLTACDAHKQVLEILACQVHPHDSACGLPGARYHREDNRCQLLV